jgi:hypothetical protein
MADDWVPVDARAADTKEAGDWVPVQTAPPTSAPKTSFPNDEPGYNYGSILPFRVKTDDKGQPVPGTQELAWPELVRQPVRGALSIGGKVTGQTPIDPTAKTLTPDEFSALGVGGLGSPATAESAAAKAVAAARATTQADRDAALAVLPKPADALTGRETKTMGKAIKKVETRAAQDVEGSHRTAQDILDDLKRGKALGKPLTLPDVGGSNIKGLAGNVARQPGASQNRMHEFYDDRDTGAGTRLGGDVLEGVAEGPSAYRSVKALKQSRVETGAPLYERAFEGGSIAPLERQFEHSFDEASKAEIAAGRDIEHAQMKITTAKAKQTQASNVYSASAANQELRDAETELAKAQRAQVGAANNKIAVLDMLHQAQEDRTLDRPGAVWNPRIQQLMSNPDVRAGVPRGLRIIRNEADAAGARFDPTEYAITGEKNGEPVVSKVPNMRLLDAAKRGLDAIIAENRDADGHLNQLGRSANQLRVALLNELDQINPEYKTARDAWAGDSASIDAVMQGKNFTKLSPEQIEDDFAELSSGEKEFFKLGVADSLLERLGKTTLGGDEAKKIYQSTWAKGQLKPVFKTEADFEKFIEAADYERKMFEVRQELLRGSQTAGRGAEDNPAQKALPVAHMTRGGMEMASGNVPWGLYNIMRAGGELFGRRNPMVDDQVARMLSDPEFAWEVRNGHIHVPNLPRPGPAFAGPPGGASSPVSAQTLQLLQQLSPGAVPTLVVHPPQGWNQ